MAGEGLGCLSKTRCSSIYEKTSVSLFLMSLSQSSLKLILTRIKKKSIIGVIYIPNTRPRADIDVFSSILFEFMALIIPERKSCLVKFESHDKTGDYINNIFFMPMILKPTRISQTSATLIDHIYSNDIFSFSTSGLLVTGVADHLGVFF